MSEASRPSRVVKSAAPNPVLLVGELARACKGCLTRTGGSIGGRSRACQASAGGAHPKMLLVRLLLLIAIASLGFGPAADAAPLVCLDPGHSIPPNSGTEPIGPGSSIRKIKDGGGAAGEAKVVLQIAWKTRRVLLDRGYRVAMTRTGPTFTYGNGGNIARANFCN